MRKSLSLLVWLLVVLLGTWGYYHMAAARAEPLNSGYILVAALCTYALGYRFYAKWIAARVLALNDRRATPCEVHEDGQDFVRTNKWIVFGHHFAAISGPGPLVGPVLAAQFGYLPGTLWILIGAVLGGAVQDFVILFASVRRDGKSLGEMLKDELSPAAGRVGLLSILAILIVLLAVLALVIVNALAESPWGIFTVGATIPIALGMGGYLRYVRVGKVLEISVVGVVLLLMAVWGGQGIHAHPALAAHFTIGARPLAWSILLYGFAASVLPVWLLLAPRDYLSTFMKLGTIFALIAGVLMVLPDLRMPALSVFANGSGLVVPGPLFPFCFITIACGAISGFHTLISSGITPKIITRERYVRPVAYGAMLLESLVAIVAMIAACTLDPGVYLAMNVKGAGATPAAIALNTKAQIEHSGFTSLAPVAGASRSFQSVPVQVSIEGMGALAREMGEPTLFGKTGGAATLAVGMAQIFARFTQGRGMGLWYHFAIMFEALFILTTLDAGTRVGRYLLQDVLGLFWKPLGETKSVPASVLASALVVAGWGSFLIMGVNDPNGGVKALWPIFGIANQLLAAIALCLATTVLLKSGLPAKPAGGRLFPARCLVTLLPLAWLLSVTLSAGALKVMSPDPKIGFFAGAAAAGKGLPDLEAKFSAARAAQDTAAFATAARALQSTRTTIFNARIDGVVTTAFLALVLTIIAISLHQWFLLLRRQKAPALRETEPTWLEAPEPASTPSVHALGAAALALSLLKELSGEAALDRAQQAHTTACFQDSKAPTTLSRQNTYLTTTERRFASIRRCC